MEGTAGWRDGAVARCRVGHHLEPSLAGEGSQEDCCSAAGFGVQLRPWSRGLPPPPLYSLGPVRGCGSPDRFWLFFPETTPFGLLYI